MPDEIPKQIDEALKSYAAKRRKDFNPALPPQLRQIVRREVDQAHGKVPEMSFGAMLRKFWPQFGIAFAASAVMAVSLFVYSNRPDRQRYAVARDYETEALEKKDAAAPVANGPRPTGGAGPVNPPSASRDLKEASSDLGERSLARESQAASAPVPAQVPAAPDAPSRETAAPRYSRLVRAAEDQEPKLASAAAPELTEAKKMEGPKVAAQVKTEALPAKQPEVLALRLAKDFTLAATAAENAVEAEARQVSSATLTLSRDETLSRSSVSLGLLNNIVEKEKTAPAAAGNVLDKRIEILAEKQEFSKVALSNFSKESQSQSTPAVSELFSNSTAPAFVNKAPASNPQVLQNFKMFEERSVLKLVDQDGSVYMGNVITATAGGNRRQMPESGSIRNGGFGGGGGFSNNQSQQNRQLATNSSTTFYAQGVNQTLNQQVQINGRLHQENERIEQNQAIRTRRFMSPKEATLQNYRITPQKAVPVSQNGIQTVKISGIIQVGETNMFPLEAIPKN